MNAEQERQLRTWLKARDPGDAPDSLRASAAEVPYATRPALFPTIDAALARFSRLSMPVRAVLVLLVLAALVVAMVGAMLLRPWQPFPPRGLIAITTPQGVTGGTGIRLVSAEGTGERTVTPTTSGAFDHSPRWSADGKTLLFARNQAPLDGTNYCPGVGSVVLFDVATGIETVLANGLRPINVVEWSPAGSRIAVTHPAPGCSGGAVFLSVVDVASGRVTTSKVDEGTWHVPWTDEVSWAGEEASAAEEPEGKAVLEVLADDGELVARCDPPGFFEGGPIEVIDKATGVTINLGPGAAPAWSPDSTALAFAQVADPSLGIGLGRVQLGIANIGDWEVRLLGEVIHVSGPLDRSFRQLALRWTPDGSSIYWTDATGGHVVDVATGRLADLPPIIDGSSDPRWQPRPD